MGLVVNNNPASDSSAQHLARINEALKKSSAKLSSGSRIPTAAADAAGLAISGRLQAQVSALGQSSRNAYDGVSAVETAEGSLGQVSDILGRLKELSVQAGNGTLSDADRETLQNEANDLLKQIDQVAGSSDFNGVNLLDGSVSSLEINVGAGTEPGIDSLHINLEAVTAGSLGLSTFDIGPGGDRGAALAALDQSIGTVNQARARLGATQNRLYSAIENTQQQITSLTEADSRIRDVDVAKESSQLVQLQIQSQAATAIHAQARLQPQAALSLLAFK
ncbi:MAG: flagellin [Planctomycetota bacterium]